MGNPAELPRIIGVDDHASGPAHRFGTRLRGDAVRTLRPALDARRGR
ncbi:hypothetical protein [Streptomyces sp. NPDC053427]